MPIKEVKIFKKTEDMVTFQAKDGEIIEVPICQKCQCFKWNIHDKKECKRKEIINNAKNGQYWICKTCDHVYLNYEDFKNNINCENIECFFKDKVLIKEFKILLKKAIKECNFHGIFRTCKKNIYETLKNKFEFFRLFEHYNIGIAQMKKFSQFEIPSDIQAMSNILQFLLKYRWNNEIKKKES